jgi:hypothetical protein
VIQIITHGTIELPEGSLTIKRTIIGGVIATRDKGVVPNAAVLTGCCSISRWYVLKITWSPGSYLDITSSYLLFVSARREDTCIRGCGRTAGCVDDAKSEIIGLEGLRIRFADCDD